MDPATAIIIGSTLLGGSQLYSGYKRAQASRKQAKALEKQADETRTSSIAKIKQLQAEQADRAAQHETEISATRERTRAQSAAATAAQQNAIRQINQQQASSRLAIQQSNLQARIAKQQQAGNVTKRTRRRVGSPLKLRTGVQANSALAFGGSGTKSSKGSSKLNV